MRRARSPFGVPVIDLVVDDDPVLGDDELAGVEVEVAQRSPASSPRRIPVVAASRHSGHQRSALGCGEEGADLRRVSTPSGVAVSAPGRRRPRPG